MKQVKTIAVLAFVCAAGAGCTRQMGGAEVPMAFDSLDGVMRYKISRVDAKTSEVVLVPAMMAEQEIEPQAGQELRLSLSEFAQLSGKGMPSASDAIKSVDEGAEVIIHGNRLGIPTATDDIRKIELLQPKAK